jgi:hypothetical protein
VGAGIISPLAGSPYNNVIRKNLIKSSIIIILTGGIMIKIGLCWE